VWWFRLDGRKMTRRDWQDGAPILGMFLNGQEIPTPGPHGEDIEDDSFVLLFNASSEVVGFMLPRRPFGAQWTLEVSTADPAAEPGSQRFGYRTEVKVPSHSIVILKRVT
jgi:glycogen operon protein